MSGYPASCRRRYEGVRILELARNAERLFERQEPRQKRRLLNFVVSNCTWDDGEVIAPFRQPLDLLAEITAIATPLRGGDTDNPAKSEIWLGMNLELLLLGDAPVACLIERARLAEANGYAAVWLADERFYREVYICLGQLAAHTSRVLLGPCVTDPYTRHPALTAMAIATLDEISGGRAILGIGAGISGFAELGVDRRKPARAIRESIELVRALLRGEIVDLDGEVIAFNHGRLSFSPLRPALPIYVASNGSLGQRMAAELADGAIMEACASMPEVGAFRAAITTGAAKAGRDPQAVRVVARLNTCIAAEGRAARDAVRPAVARYLGAGRLRARTTEAQGLALPAAAVASVAGGIYAAGVMPYLPLLPLITDRHVDAFALAGTIEEVAEHAIALSKAGADTIIARPFAPEGGKVEETIVKLGSEVWPRVVASAQMVR
jgi:5,10-methylenetetrahydromethanopterin reductase